MDRRGFLKGAIAAGIGLVTAKLPRSQPTEIAVRSHPIPVLDNLGISSARLANRGTPCYNTFGISGEEIREAIKRRTKVLEELPPLKGYWPMGTLNVKDRTLELSEQTSMSKENAFFIAVMEAAEVNVDSNS